MGELAYPAGEPFDIQARIDHLEIERASAWFEYQEQTCGLKGPDYETVEPWSYALLCQRLKRIEGWLSALTGPTATIEQ